MKYNQTLNMNYYNVDEASNIFNKIISNNDIQITGQKSNKFVDISCSFDIESTSFYDNDEKTSLMYVWQFGITDDSADTTYVIMGRTWSEFLKLIRIISNKFNFGENIYFPIYIHKLGFEFNFMRPLFGDKIDQVFALNSNKPIYFRTGCIEFRCSYMLSGLKLEKLPTTKYKKAVGDLDYSLIRHTTTELTDKEISYCMLDVLVLCEYISMKRKQDGSIGKMLYTKTSYVRQGLQKKCRKNKQYKNYVNRLKFHSYKEFLVINKSFVGGHASFNNWHINKTVSDVIEYDVSSFYPSVIVCEDRFPTAFKEYKDIMDMIEYEFMISHNYAIVCMATFKNLKSKTEDFENFIQTAQIIVDDKDVDVEYKRGRLVSCNGKCSIFLTNLEYEIIKWFYDYDEVTFNYCYVYKTGYLPTEVVEYTLELYENKTKLKNTEYVTEYNNWKDLLNSIFGSSVMNPCKAQADVDLSNGHWKRDNLSLEQKVEQIEKYNTNIFYGKITMPYIWGVYITALARYNLATCIYNTGKYGCWVYSDTDSLYMEKCQHGENFIAKYNSYITDKMNRAMQFHKFEQNRWIAKTIDGREKPLGYFENKGLYSRFKVIGIKRYLKYSDDGKLTITLSGLANEKAGKYLLEKYKNIDKIFENFEEGLKIPAEHTGRFTSTILNKAKQGYITDYNGVTEQYKTLGGVHLEPSPYEFSIYMDRINWLFGVITTTE